MQEHAVDRLAAGHEALARGAWEEARDLFTAAAAAAETPEALEGLGVAAWWLDDGETTLDARERAYRLFVERGDRLGAARVATWLAWEVEPRRRDLRVRIV